MGADIAQHDYLIVSGREKRDDINDPKKTSI